MKKTLLAAALALGFTGVAQAETSVTLYGILDGGIGYQNIDNAGGKNVDSDRFGLIGGVQSGNRWGLRGTEDLGNGLQAVFQAESGFDIGTGHHQQGDRLFGRHLTLGLQSDAWGRLDLGRQTNIASKYFAGVANPFADAFLQAGVANTFGVAATTRWDNMVMYQTPNFAGFQFGIGYSFNTDGSQSFDTDDRVDGNHKGITTGIRYANGPLAAALTYDQVKRDDGQAWSIRTARVNPADPTGPLLSADTRLLDVGGKVKAWNLGASYDFEVVKLHAGFGQTRDGMIGTHKMEDVTLKGGASSGGVYFAEGLDANAYTLGLSAPVGGGSVMFAWNMLDIDDFDGNEFEKQQVYSLGYTYPLSKRTNVYALGSYAKNVYGNDDVDSTLVGVGVRHQF